MTFLNLPFYVSREYGMHIVCKNIADLLILIGATNQSIFSMTLI